jgi:DNA-binding IclR family transcriptional regulator
VSEDGYIVPALQRGLAILRGFDRVTPVMSLAEIAKRNGLPKATAFRLVHTLEEAGCLVREAGGQGYRLGPGVLALGFGYLDGLGLPEIARPVLERLRDATGASTHLAIRDGAEIVYLVRVPGQSALASNIGVGTRLPAHGATMGRALLLDLGADELADLVDEAGLDRLTDQTPTTLEALRATLRRDRERGYVVSRSYYEKGVVSVAAPVRDTTGRAVAAISVVGSELALTPETVEGAVKDQVLEAAAEISRWLGHAPAAAAE